MLVADLFHPLDIFAVAMFDRYNIVNEADLAAAVAKRFNGKVTAKSEGFAEQAS